MSDIHSWVTTAIGIDGFRVKRNIGLVRGITVRSRSIFGSIGAGLQSLAGGNISLFTELAEASRKEAYELMVRHAQEVGANAIIAVRYDATEISQGISEMVCYGTAVVIERADIPARTS